MPIYALLEHPVHRRIYTDAAREIALAELRLAGRCLADGGEAYVDGFGGPDCFVIAAREDELPLLAGLSFVYAAYELRGTADEPLLRPVALPPAYLDENVTSILKYAGKTNERFTRLLVNAAVFAGDFARAPRLSLLDPVAGKGTTLFEALSRGYDASGMEIGGRVVHEASVYLKKYLETAKYKHTLETDRVSGENRVFTAERYRFTLGRDKREIAESPHRVTMVAGDARYADRCFPKESFEGIVGDLPYGIEHGNVTNEKQTGITRSPSELLDVCLPAWRRVLKPGGAMALAWNTFVLPRAAMREVVEKHGFRVLEDAPFDAFAHRVDQAIRRDILVARREK